MMKKNLAETSNFLKSICKNFIECPQFTKENQEKIKEFVTCKAKALIILGIKKALNLIKSGEISNLGITPFHLVILTSKKHSHISEIQPYCVLKKNASKERISQAFTNLLNAQSMWRQALEKSMSSSFTAEKSSESRKYKTYLVVDDNAFVRKAISRQLYMAYNLCKVVECENGLIALNEIQKDHDKFDIVLMDYNMPVMDGIEAARKIREFEQEKKLHKVVIFCIFYEVEYFLLIVMSGDDKEYIPIKSETHGLINSIRILCEFKILL